MVLVGPGRVCIGLLKQVNLVPGPVRSSLTFFGLLEETEPRKCEDACLKGSLSGIGIRGLGDGIDCMVKKGVTADNQRTPAHICGHVLIEILACVLVGIYALVSCRDDRASCRAPKTGDTCMESSFFLDGSKHQLRDSDQM